MKDAKELDLDGTKWTQEQLKSVIRRIHQAWYSNEFDLVNVRDQLFLHRHLSGLFTYANITETLHENNPSGMTAELAETILDACSYDLEKKNGFEA